jgi:hypothetical protein
MQRVTLDNWHIHPVYCPFCGTPIGPDTEGKECKHLLFVVWECMFYYASDRFTTLTGIVADGYPLPNGLNSVKGVETIGSSPGRGAGPQPIYRLRRPAQRVCPDLLR